MSKIYKYVLSSIKNLVQFHSTNCDYFSRTTNGTRHSHKKFPLPSRRVYSSFTARRSNIPIGSRDGKTFFWRMQVHGYDDIRKGKRGEHVCGETDDFRRGKDHRSVRKEKLQQCDARDWRWGRASG